MTWKSWAKLTGRLGVVLLAGVLTPVACSSDKSGDDDDDDGSECGKDIDCDSGEICEDGSCVRASGSGGSAGKGGSGSGGSSASGGSTTGGSAGSGGTGAIYGWTEDTTHPASYDIQALWGSGPDEVWAVAGGGDILGGGGQLLLWDGAIWDLFYSMGTPGFTDIWGVNGGSNVFFVGHGGQFYELTPSSITTLDSFDQENRGVWASAPDAVWLAANVSGYPLRFWNGEQYLDDSAHRSPYSNPVTAIWGSSANDVWATDWDGSVLHYDGTGWTSTYQLAGADFFRIHGSGPTDVWAVGPRHVIHYDGTAWSVLADGEGMAINDVWAAGPDDAWFVGDSGRILHGGSSGLTPVESGITESLFTVWGSSPTDIWAGGENGVLIHYGPVDEPTEPPDGGTMDCSPEGYGCSEHACCSPFRCTNIGGGLLVCA